MERKLCLSIDQMQKLKELGIEIKDASMCWIRDGEGNATAELHDEFCYEMSFMNPVPTFTLQDMLELMPIYIDSSLYSLELSFDEVSYTDRPVYTLQYIDAVRNVSKYSVEKENFIDAAFDMLVWLAEGNYLKEKA